MDLEKKLAELGIDLSAGPEPMANYVSVQKAGSLWFFSGAGPFENGQDNNDIESSHTDVGNAKRSKNIV